MHKSCFKCLIKFSLCHFCRFLIRYCHLKLAYIKIGALKKKKNQILLIISKNVPPIIDVVQRVYAFSVFLFVFFVFGFGFQFEHLIYMCFFPFLLFSCVLKFFFYAFGLADQLLFNLKKTKKKRHATNYFIFFAPSNFSSQTFAIQKKKSFESRPALHGK